MIIATAITLTTTQQQQQQQQQDWDTNGTIDFGELVYSFTSWVDFDDDE